MGDPVPEVKMRDGKQLREMNERCQQALMMVAQTVNFVHQSGVPDVAKVHGYEALRRLEDASYRVSEFFRTIHMMQTEEGQAAAAQDAIDKGRVITGGAERKK
jgi:hypothetical protein